MINFEAEWDYKLGMYKAVLADTPDITVFGNDIDSLKNNVNAFTLQMLEMHYQISNAELLDKGTIKRHFKDEIRDFLDIDDVEVISDSVIDSSIYILDRLKQYNLGNIILYPKSDNSISLGIKLKKDIHLYSIDFTVGDSELDAICIVYVDKKSYDYDNLDECLHQIHNKNSPYESYVDILQFVDEFINDCLVYD